VSGKALVQILESANILKHQACAFTVEIKTVIQATAGSQIFIDMVGGIQDNNYLVA